MKEQSQKIKNPLNRRIPRELRTDFRKYLVIFLFLALTIGFVAGMDVANNSMLAAQDKASRQNKLEDGHFTMDKPISISLRQTIAKRGITLYDYPYKDVTEVSASHHKYGKIRLYPMQNKINRVGVFSGRLPKWRGETGCTRTIDIFKSVIP